MRGIHVFVGTNKKALYLPGGNDYTSHWEEPQSLDSHAEECRAEPPGTRLLGQMDAIITTGHLAFMMINLRKVSAGDPDGFGFTPKSTDY